MTGLWLPNLKKFMTGTLNGGKYSVDVNVSNSTLPVALSTYAYKERRAMLASVTTIPGSGSAMIQVDAVPGTTGSGANIANTIAEMSVHWTGDGMIEFGSGADATAAAANIIGSVGRGQEKSFGVTMVAGDKLWLRSVKTTTITDGELMINLLG